jgi:hypothetical protein
LLDDGRRRDAETLWNGNCPSQKTSGLIADPSFTRVLDTSLDNPFSWRVMASGDLSIRQVPADKGAGSLALTNSAPGTRLALLQTVALPAGLYRFRANGGSGAPASRAKLYLSWGCNQKPPFPETTAGDLLNGGQEIRVDECDRQQIGIWLTGGGAPASLQSLSLERIG